MCVCFQTVNGNDLLISNLHAWSIRQLGWTEPTRPSPDKGSIFPTEGNNTFPESEETPGKIIPLLSSQNTWRGCTVFPYSLSRCKRHIQDKRSVLSALRGSARGENKIIRHRDAIEREHRYQRPQRRSKDKCSLNFLVTEGKQTE